MDEGLLKIHLETVRCLSLLSSRNPEEYLAGGGGDEATRSLLLCLAQYLSGGPDVWQVFL